MKWFCLFLALSFSGSVAGAEFNLMLGAWSTHLVTDSATNETHNLVGIEYRGYTGGYFKNSYGRDTIFLGRHYSMDVGSDFEIFGIVGVTRGYTTCMGEDGSGKNVCPLFSGGVVYTKYDAQPSLYLLGDALSIGLRWRFK